MDSFSDAAARYLDLAQTVWETSFYGMSVGRGLAAIAIVLLALGLRGLFMRFVMGFGRRVAARTDNPIDDATIEALEAPLSYLPVTFGLYLAAAELGMNLSEGSAAGNIFLSLIAYLLFWALGRATGPLSKALMRWRKELNEALIDWVVKGLRAFFYVTGAVAILSIWNIPVVPILASFSLLSVAVALGAQDLFKNLIAGALILLEHRFRPGDWVMVDGVVEGTVERINFRSTQIRRFDKSPVHVPNSKLSDNALTNFSRMSHRRIKWVIGLEYRTTAEQMKTIREGIAAYIAANEDFAPAEEVSTFVRIDRFSDSSVDILLYCFTRTTNWLEWLEVKERLALEIKRIVETAGAGFAFPSQSVYVEALPGDAPEPFPTAVSAPEPRAAAG